MSITYHDDPEKVPAAIDARLIFDTTVCELGITCGNRTAIGGHLTVDPETDGDRPAWRTFCAIRGTGDTDENAVLCCEDCGGWLEEAMAKNPPA